MPSKTVDQVHVIYVTSAEDFENIINEHLKDGWELVGSPELEYHAQGTRFLQMVKKKVVIS